MEITLTPERQAALEGEDIQGLIDARADYLIGQKAEAVQRAKVRILMATPGEELDALITPLVDAKIAAIALEVELKP